MGKLEVPEGLEYVLRKTRRRLRVSSSGKRSDRGLEGNWRWNQKWFQYM